MLKESLLGIVQRAASELWSCPWPSWEGSRAPGARWRGLRWLTCKIRANVQMSWSRASSGVRILRRSSRICKYQRSNTRRHNCNGAMTSCRWFLFVQPFVALRHPAWSKEILRKELFDQGITNRREGFETRVRMDLLWKHSMISMILLWSCEEFSCDPQFRELHGSCALSDPVEGNSKTGRELKTQLEAKITRLRIFLCTEVLLKMAYNC